MHDSHLRIHRHRLVPYRGHLYVKMSERAVDCLKIKRALPQHQWRVCEISVGKNFFAAKCQAKVQKCGTFSSFLICATIRFKSEDLRRLDLSFQQLCALRMENWALAAQSLITIQQPLSVQCSWKKTNTSIASAANVTSAISLRALPCKMANPILNEEINMILHWFTFDKSQELWEH